MRILKKSDAQVAVANAPQAPLEAAQMYTLRPWMVPEEVD
jgi:hypothetical protein